jgi:membrane-associated protease RseP (regulator of RpoE activity)
MVLILTPELSFLAGLLIFWVVLYLIAHVLHLDKRGLDVQPGYFMYRSKALNLSIDKITKKHPFLWTVLSNIGLAFSIGLMAFALYFLISNLLRFTQIGQIAYVAPVIPGLTLSLAWLPFFVFAAIVVILPHELAHGIVSRLENIPVLSTGIVAFLVFFGAFVEPDEKEFEKSSLMGRLRVLSVGSSTNLITALFVLLLLTGAFSAPAGVLIYQVIPGSPLAKSGKPVQQWDVIQTFNNTSVLSYVQYSELTKNVGPNVTVTVTILHANQKENITLVTVPNPSNLSKGIIGFEVSFIPDYHPSRLSLDQYINVNLYLTLFWVYLVAFSVAVFNMLPLYPFDGERVLYYPLERFVKNRKRELRFAISGITLALFALNIILSFWRYGLLSI